MIQTRNIVTVLKQAAEFEKDFARASFVGALQMARHVALEIKHTVTNLSVFHLSYYLASCVLILVALAPWIEYQIDFGTPESVDVGSSAKLIFLLPGLVGLLVATFELPFRVQAYRISAGLAVLVWIGGLIFPNPVHTSIHAGEFHLRWWLYLYGPLLLAQGTLSLQGLTEASIHLDRFQDRLFPPPAAPEGKAPSRRKGAKPGRA
ncbi:MAG TPA: hypothetical protein PKE49_05080 [Leptospiraceae bacterium]|jgi:hypothetical protein|nr:hypothetical protein [Leptospirales bacterium]HMU82122.1 hypothetical protein [Leptospiraceae bacterium]HMW59934.1 hypothetical protein [Leptospiraceae bacterium]HMX55873.1 hypothetical protein [Leptospiraceae bacterium]HMY44825.1 hypothetical protein [Leptospiraceae bacterium]